MCEFLSDEKLLQIKKSHPKEGCPQSGVVPFHISATEYAQNGTDKKLKFALLKLFSSLTRYKQLSACTSLVELAGKIVAEHSMFTHALARPKNVADEFSAFLDALKTLDGKLSLSEALQAIDKGALKLETAREPNTVAVMTMHASKGLEFPFVVLANLGKRFNKDDLKAECILDGKFGAALKYFDSEDRQKRETTFRTLLKALREKRALEEEMRLLYVALTRGIYQVALFGEVDEGFEAKDAEMAVSFLDWISAAKAANDQLLLDNNKKDSSPFATVGAVNDRPSCQSHAIENIPDINTIKSRINFKLATPKKILKKTATQIALGTNQSNITPKEKGEQPLQQALDFGTAYHAFMEYCDFSLPIQKNIEEFNFKFPQHAVFLEKTNLLKAASKITEKVKDKKYYKEQPFIYRDKDGTLIQGVIDLLILDNNGDVEIIDYKTGRISASQKFQYAVQLDVYAAAAQIILNTKQIKKTVFSLSNAQFLEV